MHKLLCSKFKPFITDNPRPDDMHKLALLFPEKADLPQLIWVETRVYHEENEDGSKYIHSMGCTRKLKQHLPNFARPMPIDPNPYKIQIWLDDMQQEFEGNQCLAHLTKGYASRDLAAGMISAYDWNGNQVVLGFDEQNQNSQVTKYRDVTLNDLRGVLNTLSQNMIIFEDDKVNRFIIRDESKWIKAVKVSCSGDIKFLGKAQFRQVEIKVNHPIYKSFDDISTVSENLGWTLLAKKCPFDPAWASRAATSTTDPYENFAAQRLVQNWTPTAQFGDWGAVKYPTWDPFKDPTVLFARKDQKDTTKYQIEALDYYIDSTVRMKMSDEGYGWSTKQKTALVRKYLTADAFDVFFKKYVHERLEMGQEDWRNAA